MKQRNKYLTVLIVFIVLMSIVFIFFMNKYSDIRIVNKSKDMLNDIYGLKSGKYLLKNGYVLSKDGSSINKRYYFDGNGNIEIDKYGNVRFKINYDDKCISKTYVGSIELEKNKCGNFKKISVSIVRNNSKISFFFSFTFK